LKERKEDITLLIDKFLEEIASNYGAKKKTIDKAAIKALTEAEWTGNIRELKNVMERLVIMSEGAIGLDDVKKYL